MGTGVLMLLGGEVENRCVRSGPDSYSVIGEANIQTPVCKRMSHPDFPPKLDTNAVFNPSLDETGCACAHHFPPKIFVNAGSVDPGVDG